MTVALALPTLTLSQDEHDQVTALRGRLRQVQPKNREKSALYNGDRKAKDFGIAAPRDLPELINAILGWPGTVVDVLEERIENRGWTGAEGTVLEDVYRDNLLAVESGRGHLDTLIYGCGFITVGIGDPAEHEPNVLVSVESTETCTVDWNHRLRRASSALSQTYGDNGQTEYETLYLPNETIMFARKANGELEVVGRNEHRLGRVPVARLLNRERASDLTGRSEITKPVVYYTDAAARTLAGLEINREFYTSPKWTVLNADPETFGMDEDNTPAENRAAAWKATAGNLNVIPPQVDENNQPVTPTMHEFRPAPPTPYIEQIRAYSQLLAAESGIPAPYLGFVTENPSSADSIRQQEYRLVKRAERRQTSFGTAWLEVARLALMISGEFDRERFREIGVNWRDPSTPTRAAAADEASKLIASGVLPPTSSVTWDRIGLSPTEQQQLVRDGSRTNVAALLEQIKGGGDAGVSDAAASAQEMKAKFDALGVAVRAGVDPAEAAARVGLAGISFTGAIPVSLRPAATDADRLEDR